jgi:hypothetical protein
MPPSAICWSIWFVIPSRKIFEPNRVGSISAGLAVPLAPHEPGGQQGHGDHADQQQRGDGLAALLPHEDAEHDAAHAEHRQDGTDRVDVAIARVGRIAHPLDVEQDDRDDHDLEREPHAPREVRGDEAAE